MVDEAVKILNGQLPRYFRPVIEFQEIMKAHGRGLEKLDGIMARLQANFYIPTCDEATIAYYEKLLGIAHHIEDGLDFRRTRVLQKLNLVAPFTIGFLKERLTALYGEDGYTLEVTPETCSLTIKVTSHRYGAIDLLYDLLLDILPAHLRLMANQEATSYVPGRLYVGGAMFVLIEQTIYKDTETYVDGGIYAVGIVSGTFIQTIQGGM
mgnify:CR=1 FL=1